ncbi:MAG TPA: ribonuclease HII [Anaerolineales bacterium]|nr:ribonuclease HII [Anaerolineales bacterium]
MKHAAPDLSLEFDLWQRGFHFVAGLDEAGRGALAGPVCVGAVILPNDAALLSSTLSGARDSKQLTPPARERLAALIKETALAWSVGFASAEEIDSQGIVRATRLAALRALHQFNLPPQHLLTDFRLELPHLDIPQTSLIKGDARCLSIACASILAKTERDALMRELDAQYPGYGLGKHKGYGTQAHRSALRRLGYSEIHRKTFRIKSSSHT